MKQTVRYLPAILLWVVLTAGIARAQIVLDGEVGTDLEVRSISDNLTESLSQYNVDRRLSKQFVSLRYGGPVVNRNFADITLRARLAGTYTRVNNTDNGMLTSETDYLNPEFDDIQASFTIFPLRTYPLRYTFGKVSSLSNRYEPAQRRATGVASPGLATLRQYETDLTSHRAQWQISLPRDMSFSTELTREDNSVSRQYEFQENLNIWVVFVSQPPNPSPTHIVDVLNDLDDTALLYIDLAFIDTLQAGEVLSLEIESGPHDIEIIPSRYNRFLTQVNVSSGMQWRIVYNPPKGSSDIDQISEGAEARLKIGETGRFQDEARLKYSLSDDGVQNTNTRLSTVDNQARYMLKRNMDIRSLTTLTSTVSEVPGISLQDIGSLLQQTQLRWVNVAGPSVSVMHSYSDMNSETLEDAVRSKTHLINMQGAMPTGWKGHIADGRLTSTLTKDDKGYDNKQYMAGLGNRLLLRWGRANIIPQHDMKYTRSSVGNAGIETDSRELESLMRLELDRPRLPWMNGHLGLKTEWGWRSRDTQVETETKNRYFGELKLGVAVSEGLQITGLYSREAEVYSIDMKATPLDGTAVKVRPDQNRQMYRLDVRGRPAPALTITASGMWINQDGTRTTRGQLAVSGNLPIIKLPLRAFATAESRMLSNGGDQSLLQIEAQTTYRFRQINMILSYSLFAETLAIEDYTYSEFYIKISRAFKLI